MANSVLSGFLQTEYSTMSKANSEPSWKKVFISVIGGLIVAATIAAIRCWSSILSQLESVMNWLTDPISVSRLWFGTLLLSFVVLVVFILAIVVIAVYSRNSKQDVPQQEYKQDLFFNLIWKWDWVAGILVGISAYCPRCKRIMRYSEESEYYGPTHFHCQGCSHSVPLQGNREEVDKSVRVEIKHKIDTGNWKEPFKQNHEIAS